MAKKTTPKSAQAAPKKAAASAPRPSSGGGDSFAWLPWALAGLALLLYASGFSNPMVAMDDHSATVNNPAVKNFDLFGQFNLGMYAPVTWAGYAIAYTLGKSSAFWYHFLSALVHACNVVLVFRLFRHLMPDWRAASVVALFFAIHPMQVEAVSWIAGFSTPLFSLFYLLALLFYVQYLNGQRSMMLSLALFCLACLAKTAAVTLPLTLLVVDIWKGRRLEAKLVWEKIPFFVLSVFFGVLTLYSRGEAGHTTAGEAAQTYNLLDRALMVCHTLPFYWTKLLVPFNLSIWYPFEKNNGAWPLAYWLAPLALTAIGWAAWRFRKEAPIVGKGLLWYLSNIVLALPFATFGTFELRSDRYNYLACLGIFAVLAVLPKALGDKKPAWANIAWVFLAALALFYAVQSAARIRDWGSTLTLINKAMAAQGDNFGKAYYWRGMEYGDAGKNEEAIADFDKAIAQNPSLIEAYKYRGGLLGMVGQPEKALADLNIYLAKYPNDVEYRFNRGIALRKLNRNEEAIADFTKTIELRPDFAPAYRSRAFAYSDLGDQAKAAADMAEFKRRSGER